MATIFFAQRGTPNDEPSNRYNQLRGKSRTTYKALVWRDPMYSPSGCDGDLKILGGFVFESLGEQPIYAIITSRAKLANLSSRRFSCAAGRRMLQWEMGSLWDVSKPYF